MFYPLRQRTQRSKAFECPRQMSGAIFRFPMNSFNIHNFGLVGDGEPILAPRGSTDRELSIELQGVDTFRRGAEI